MFKLGTCGINGIKVDCRRMNDKSFVRVNAFNRVLLHQMHFNSLMVADDVNGTVLVF